MEKLQKVFLELIKKSDFASSVHKRLATKTHLIMSSALRTSPLIAETFLAQN